MKGLTGVRRHGRGARRVALVAGLHGREVSAIQLALEMSDMLERESERLRGEVCVVPLVAREGAALGLRENPEDGNNLNRSFGLDRNSSASAALASEVWNLVRQYEWVVDLHSAGPARYLPHVIYRQEQTVPALRRLGLPFLIRRMASGTLTSLAASAGLSTCALEVGGGETVFEEDLHAARHGLLRLLRFLGILEHDVEERETPPTAVWDRDARAMVRSEASGLLLHHVSLGARVGEGDVLGSLLLPRTLERRPHRSPAAGWVIYRRTRALITEGDTAYMVLSQITPLQEVAG